MTKYPYSTTHYHCGCHIIEDREGFTDLVESIYCADALLRNKMTVVERDCLYLPILRMRRRKASRLA